MQFFCAVCVLSRYAHSLEQTKLEVIILSTASKLKAEKQKNPAVISKVTADKHTVPHLQANIRKMKDVNPLPPRDYELLEAS